MCGVSVEKSEQALVDITDTAVNVTIDCELTYMCLPRRDHGQAELTWEGARPVGDVQQAAQIIITTCK